MFVPKEDRHKHKILEILLAKKAELRGKKNPIPCQDISIHVNEIGKQLNIKPQRVRELESTLVLSQEALYCKATGQTGFLCAWEKGFVAFSERKYLKQGRAYRLSEIKDNLYIIVSTIAIISAIGSLTLYINNIRNIEREVFQLRKEVKEMKNQQSQPNLQTQNVFDSAQYN